MLHVTCMTPEHWTELSYYGVLTGPPAAPAPAVGPSQFRPLVRGWTTLQTPCCEAAQPVNLSASTACAATAYTRPGRKEGQCRGIGRAPEARAAISILGGFLGVFPVPLSPLLFSSASSIWHPASRAKTRQRTAVVDLWFSAPRPRLQAVGYINSCSLVER
jgi:hypothetical protein